MKRVFIILAFAMISAIGLDAQEYADTLGFEKSSVLYFTDMLEGKMSGVSLSASSSNPLDAQVINIRGLNSIRGNSQPLIIIDGVMTNQEITHLNPYDIKSIEVIKDASALALYGSKGANGVILVNTQCFSEKKSSVEWHSNVDLKKNVDHNHFVKFSGSTKTFSYNLSGYYKNVRADKENGRGDFFCAKAGFRSTAGKYIKAGADIWFGMDKQDRSSIMDNNIAHTDASISAWLTVNFLKCLNWKTVAGSNFSNSKQSLWYGNDSELGKSLNGFASIFANKNLDANLMSTLNFERYFSVHHYLTAQAGVELISENNTRNTQEGYDFFDHSLKADGINLMNSARVIQNYNYDYFNLGLLGKISYRYKDIAGVNLSVRADNNAKYEDNKYRIYPAASAFVQMFGVTLEGGWGRTGMQKLLPYISEDVDMQPYLSNMCSAVTDEWHIGLSGSFFKGRLNASLKYYDKYTKDSDVLYNFGVRGQKYLYYSGRTIERSTTSDIANRGFELDISAVVLKLENWRWNLTGNITYNCNQITKRDYRDYWVIPGYSAGVILAYEVDQAGYYIDGNADGRISAADCLIFGDTLPKLTYGAGTTLSYKNFTFDLLLDGSAMNQGINKSLMEVEQANKITRRYISAADRFNLRRISLKYDIPLKSKCIKGLNVSVSGLNLVQVSRLEGDLMLDRSCVLGFAIVF